MCKHKQLIDNNGKPVFCEECEGKICKICGACFDEPLIGAEYIPKRPRDIFHIKERLHCTTCGIFVKKPVGVPPGKDCVIACTRGHEVTYHSPAIWFVQGFRDSVTGIEGNDKNIGLSTMKPLKTIGEAMRRCASPDVITVANPDFKR